MYLCVICMISRHWFQTTLPNFLDFGTKISFCNQKRNKFINHYKTLPVYQEAADIRDVYLYKKLSEQVMSWYTGDGGGAMFYGQKRKGCQRKTHKIRYRQREITLIVHFLINA